MARSPWVLVLAASIAVWAPAASGHGKVPRWQQRPAAAMPPSARFAPAVHHYRVSAPARPVVRTVVASHTSVFRPARVMPVRVTPVPVPVPYYVAVPSYPPAPSLAAYASPVYTQNWNWTRVDSIAELSGRQQVRYFCPDSREYYPTVETCPSDWLKVVP